MAIERVLPLFLGLCCILSQGTLAAEATTLRVRAYIDGKSRLIVTLNTVCWAHLGYAKPGLWNELNEPTYVNGYASIPSWPSGSATAAESSSPLPVNLSLSGAVELTKVTARWQADIAQQ